MKMIQAYKSDLIRLLPLQNVGLGNHRKSQQHSVPPQPCDVRPERLALPTNSPAQKTNEHRKDVPKDGVC